MADWLEGWEQRPRSDSGPMLRGAGRCLLLHTMEGSFAGGVGTLDRNNNWPHLAYDPATRQKIQAVPFSRAAKSLMNRAGGVETNRWGVIQVELSGFAGESHTWPDEWLRNIAVDVVAPVMAAQGVRPHAVPFYGTDAGFTLATANAPQRMSFDDWLAYDGICGHQHAPENDHWDPGKLNVPRILALATGGGKKDDDMAWSGKDARDQHWFIGGAHRSRVSPAQVVEANKPALGPAYVEFRGFIPDSMLTAYIDADAWPRRIVAWIGKLFPAKAARAGDA